VEVGLLRDGYAANDPEARACHQPQPIALCRSLPAFDFRAAVDARVDRRHRSLSAYRAVREWYVDEPTGDLVEAVFPLDRGFRLLSRVTVGFLMFIGLVAIVDIVSRPDSERASSFAVYLLCWLALVASYGFWASFRMPRRIEVSPAGLRFVARTRTVVVPWRSLRRVAAPRFDPKPARLVWEWDGHRLRTWAGYEDLDRLLRIVEERAPRADIRTH
jgi:hypothetical protein